MQTNLDETAIGMSITRGCLIVQITFKLYDDIIQDMQMLILNRVKSEQLKGLILDLSSMQIIDSYTFTMITDTIKMVQLLGISSVIIGLNPGIVASIVDLNVEMNNLTTARNLENAIAMINSL